MDKIIRALNPITTIPQKQEVILALENENDYVLLVVVNDKGERINGGVLAKINESGVDTFRDISRYGWPTEENNGLAKNVNHV